MAEINVFGGFGFVGSEYCRISKDVLVKNFRENIGVFSPDVVEVLT